MTLGSAPTHDQSDTARVLNSHDAGLMSSVSRPNLAGPLRRADFVGCVDGCVHLLVAEPDAGLTDARRTRIEAGQAQLRAWLHSQTQTLDDGTPIDFALFDAAILSIEERVPQRGPQAHVRLLHASRLLAESVYAKRCAEANAQT